jgi:peptide/nickel transport system ATP-binding protein
MALIEVQDLRVEFGTSTRPTPVVHGLSFSVQPGETLAVAGESGSGKSVTALSILGLLEASGARVSGHIALNGRDLLGLPEAEMRKLRGGAIGMVFQEPMSSLNPVLTIGFQLAEAIRLHRRQSGAATRARVIELLGQVGIPAPERVLRQYPHQLSGGMRQRVMIAIALACEPQLLIADEPTTALDVTVQAQILALIRAIQARSNCGVILITHDLGVVAELADRVIIMYAGRKVEEAGVEQIFSNPVHPYTRGLLAARPVLDAAAGERPARLAEIPGAAPFGGAGACGCAFAPRCPAVLPICHEARPKLVPLGQGHLAACHRLEPNPEVVGPS